MRSKVAVVASREFMTTVRRPSYLIATLGMPLFGALILAVSLIPALIVARKEAETRTVGIVDRSGALKLDREIEFTPPPPPQLQELVETQLNGKGSAASVEGAFARANRLVLRPYATLEDGQRALRSKELSSLLEFPPDYVATGRVTAYQKEGVMGPGKSTGYDLVRKFVVERLLAGRIDPALQERVRRPMNVTALTLRKDGSFEPQDLLREISSFVVPLVFTVLFFISVTMSSGFMLQGVSEEKENRVIEVILSSIRAEDLLTGKLIGLGGAGLLQIAVWSLLVLIVEGKVIPTLRVRPEALLASIVFYVLGFLLYGILLTGTGALGQNLKESQQYGMMWSLGSAVPMMFMVLLLSEPNGVLARVLSFIPLTAPGTMFLRLNSPEPPPWWEVALAAGALAAAVWLTMKAMAKLFRVGLLLYGKSPTIPEIVRLMRRPPA